MKEFIELVAQLVSLCGVFPSHQIGSLQQFAGRWCLVVNVVLVPAQLQIILSVHVWPIRVAEGNVAYTV